MLTKEAFNALLKILEEPPAHVIFILATTEINQLLPTIISRCQTFDFRGISLKHIESRLFEIKVAEHINISDEAIKEIARLSDGGLRDAISLLDQTVSFSTGNDVEIVCFFHSIGDINIDIISFGAGKQIFSGTVSFVCRFKVSIF